jgi:hypothetical protein
MSNRLTIVNPDDRDELIARTARDQRIDALHVDRSCVKGLAVPCWSPEAEEPEARLKEIREETTLQQRFDAWRSLFKLTL